MTSPKQQLAAGEQVGAVEERISWFPVLGKEEQAPDVQALCERARATIGFVPNVFRVYAWRPQRFLKWFAHFRDVLRGTPGLSEADRELIGAVVSFDNRCIYCLTSHGASARVLTGDPALVDRAVVDLRRAGLDERREAMLDYARTITRNPEACSEDDIKRLRSCGFSDSDIWDIAEVAAMFNFTNRLANATAMLPNREYYTLGR